jgi:16S rRNA (uracil1498-N3)-methyltransferase
MRLTRVYVHAAAGELQPGAELQLPDSAAAHVARVLRLRPGAAITIFDGRGGEWAAEIVSIVRSAVRVRCGQHQALERESPLQLTLLQSLARGEKMDWVIQKATELGVQRIVTVAAARSVVQIDDKRSATRLVHWRAVAVSACEQCGRNRPPEIDAPRSVQDALDATNVAAAQATAALPVTRLLLSPAATLSLADATNNANNIALLVGPEGGFSADELGLLGKSRFVGVGLGPRVLRTETAAIAAVAALQALRGDLRA